MKFASATFLLALALQVGLVFGQAAADKPTTATPVSANATPAAEKEMTPRENFLDRRAKWKTYEENLQKNDKTDGLISYEKDIIKRMLAEIEPVNKALAGVDDTKEVAINEGLALMDSRIVILSIYEDELKRAGQIRNLLVKVQESKNEDLSLKLRDLPALSTQIYEMQMNLSSALQKYRQTSEELARSADAFIALRKEADEKGAKLEKLKKEHPDVYKSLMEDEKKK